jgi:hypothetical protein
MRKVEIMGWNPEKDRHLKPDGNPEKKPELPPKGQRPSDKALRDLGRTAVRGAQGKR